MKQFLALHPKGIILPLLFSGVIFPIMLIVFMFSSEGYLLFFFVAFFLMNIWLIKTLFPKLLNRIVIDVEGITYKTQATTDFLSWDNIKAIGVRDVRSHYGMYPFIYITTAASNPPNTITLDMQSKDFFIIQYRKKL